MVRARINGLAGFGVKAKKKDSAEDVLRNAGADFGLSKIPLAEWSGKASNPGQFVVVRQDTQTAIGMVGGNYRIFNNVSFFPPIADALMEHTDARIDSFSMLDGGARAIMRLSWDDNMRIGDPDVGDIVGRRAIISTSHDSKWAGKLVLEVLRLACKNGMTVPCGEASSEMNLTHSVGGRRQLRDIVQLIPRIANYFLNFSAAATIMSQTEVIPNSPICNRIIGLVVDPDRRAGNTQGGEANAARERVDRIAHLFDGGQPGADNRAVHRTAWGLHNAFADFYNHDRDTRGENADENRFRAMMPGTNGGSGAKSVVRAWNIVNDELGIADEIKALCN